MERQVVFEVDECTIRRLTDVICFPILVDSPDSLTMKHLLDVCTYFSHSEVLGFSVESCFIPYPRHYAGTFAFSNFSLLPPQQHASRFACPALRRAGGQLFHVPHNRPNEQLRRALYAGSTSVPCKQLEDLQPDHLCKHEEAQLKPVNPGRSVARDGA